MFTFDMGFTARLFRFLSHAQTSGGLLIAAPKETNVDFSEIEKSHGVTIKEIGNITDRYNKKINIISN